jgi:hypothetical protein
LRVKDKIKIQFGDRIVLYVYMSHIVTYCLDGVCAILLRLYIYFYGASKKSLHKPRVTFGNM